MSSREPSPRVGHAAVGIGRKLYVWGGVGSPGIQSNTIHSFDVPSLSWEEPRQFSGFLPDRLFNMAVTTDGERAYSFGGKHRTSSKWFKCKKWTYTNTVYQLNPAKSTLRELTPANSCSPCVPRLKYWISIVHFDQKLVICHHEDRGPEELYVFDLGERVWAVQPTTGEVPPRLCDYTFTKIDHHRAVVVFNWLSDRMDVCVLDTETWHWTKLTVSGDSPPARSDHAACCIAGPLTGQQHPLLMVVGGEVSFSEGSLGDVWLLNLDQGVWSEVNLPEAITPRWAHSAVVFGSGPSFRVVVLFGGIFSYTESLIETTLLLLELRGGSWEVTRVVNLDEVERPDERLREHMKQMEFSHQKELQTNSTTVDGAASSTTTIPSSPTHTIGAETKTSATIDINEVRMGKRLGQGGFGTVYEAKWKKKIVAAKVCVGNLLENHTREIQILTSLPPHPHVLTFFGVALSSDAVSTYIITELAPNGSLYDYLHDKKEEPSLDQSLAWAQQIASGMQHLHDNNVVHRDLKSGNVLLSLGLLAKICDFGTARILAKTAKTTQKGTYRWMAPEVVEDVETNINKLCDVFSYGMVLYEIFDRKIPFADIPGDAVAGVAVMQGKRPPIPANLPPYLHPLLEACWSKDPNQRPHFEAIVVAIQTQSFE